MRLRDRRLALALAYASLGLVSCDNPLSPEGDAVARLEATPPALLMVAGETRNVTIRVLTENGRVLTDRTVFWSTQGASIATVSQSGIVTAVGSGNTQVAASAGGKSVIVPITVSARPVTQVRIVPATTSVEAGATTTLRADAVDATGSLVPGRPVIWSSSANTIATVTSQGLITGVTAGNATITATVDGVSGTASVTVTPIPVAAVTVTPNAASINVGQSIQLSAATASSTGQTLNGRLVTWSSSASAIATVSSSGLVTGISSGNATITATSEGISSTAQVTVSPVPVASIRVTPSDVTVAAGQTTQLTAQPLDASGNVLNQAVTWNSEAPTVATVSTAGRVTGISAGTVQINARVGTVIGFSTVTVSAVPIARIDVTPSVANISIGNSQQLTATPRDAAGNALPGRSITWLTGAPSIASVSQTGRVTGIAGGTALVFAASEGQSGSASITVAGIPVASVTVSPPTGNLQQGQSLQLTATPRDAQGTPLTGRTVVWTSTDESIATVSSTGRLIGITPGTATIRATVEGTTGTGTYSVTRVPVGSVQVSPVNFTLSIGGAQALVATLLDGSGSPLSPAGRVISWVSSNPSVATVSNAGVVTGVVDGTATITVTCEGRSATANVTVSQIPVVSVTLAPNTVALDVGASSGVTATARDASNNVLTGRPVTWSSSTPAVATVSTASTAATNTITAVATGSATISAVVGGVTGVATVTVSQVPIATITVSGPTSVVEGSSITLTAATLGAGGVVLTGRTIVWSSDNPQVSVSQAGVVTAVLNAAAQTATITASSPGGGSGGSTPSGTAGVTVAFAPVGSVSSTPAASVSVGNTVSLTASLAASGGQFLSPTGRTVSWSSLDAGIATVSATGVVSAIAPGQARIRVTASSPGQVPPFPEDTTIVTVNNIAVASVSIAAKSGPTPGSIHVGPYSRKFVAVPRDAQGNPLTNRSVVWSVSDPANVIISQQGDSTTVSATGLGAGSVTLSATSEGITGSLGITIDLVAVTTVLVTPPSASLNIATSPTVALTAAPQDSAGNAITGSALGGRTTSWGSSATGVATVSNAGLVTAVGGGTATITATVSGPSGNSGTSAITVAVPVSQVVISAAPDSVIVPGTTGGTVTVRDAGSNVLSGRTVSLTSSNPALATVAPASATSNAGGQVTFTVTGIAAGSVTINASSEGVSQASNAVRVLAAINAIALTPATDSIIGTGTLSLTATASGAASVQGRPLAISSGTAAVATVSPTTGVTDAGGAVALTVTAVSSGTSVISVTGEGKSAIRTVRVLAPVASVAVSAATDSIIGTGTLQLAATLKDAANNTLAGRPVTWAVASGTSATVNASGLVTGAGVGSTTFTATSEGITSTAFSVRVLAAVNTVTITASDSSIEVGQQTQGSAVLRDASNNVITGRPVSWSSSNPGKATVNSTGQIVAVDSGSTTISATSEGRTGSFTLTVSLVPASSVTITPSGPTDSTGRAITFTATPRDASNNPLGGRAIAWSASNGKLQINPTTGAATLLDSGSVVVTATTTPGTGMGNTASGTSTVVILLTPVNSVAMPATANVGVASSINLVATVNDTRGGLASGRACAVASNMPLVASVGAATGTTNGSGQLTVVVNGLISGTAVITVTCEGKSGTTTVTVP